MKKLLIIFILIILGCSASTESKENSTNAEYYVIGKTQNCIYGYWKQGNSYLTFCECNHGYHCSLK